MTDDLQGKRFENQVKNTQEEQLERMEESVSKVIIRSTVINRANRNEATSRAVSHENYFDNLSRTAKLENSISRQNISYTYVRIFGVNEMKSRTGDRTIACAYAKGDGGDLTVYVIPFDEMFENPDDIISDYDVSTEEGVADYLKRQQQVLRKLISYKCPVTVISANSDDNGLTRVFASRIDALRIMRQNYFISNKSYVIGNRYKATVVSVGRTSLAVTFNGVDAVIPLWQLTYRYVQKMDHFYAVGDELEFELAACEVQDVDTIVLAADFKAPERDRMLIMQNFIDRGTSLIGIVVNVNRYKGRPRVYIDFPDAGICGYATNIRSDIIDGSIRTGDGVLCGVKDYSIDGLLKVSIIGRYNAVRSIYRTPMGRNGR